MVGIFIDFLVTFGCCRIFFKVKDFNNCKDVDGFFLVVC